MKVQPVRKPPRDHVVGGTRAGIGIERCDIRKLQRMIVRAMAVNPYEDAGIAPADRSFRNACIFESVPCGLEKDALLGVHANGLARRDVKKGSIETPHVIQKSCVPCVDLPGHADVTRIECICVPSVRRNALHCVTAFNDHPPELVGVRAASRESKAHADDRNGLRVASRFCCAQLLAQFPDYFSSSIQQLILRIQRHSWPLNSSGGFRPPTTPLRASQRLSYHPSAPPEPVKF